MNDNRTYLENNSVIFVRETFCDLTETLYFLSI